jgi:hypothetical protein
VFSNLFELKVGALTPAYNVTVYGPDGVTPLNLVNVQSAYLSMKQEQAAAYTFQSQMTVVNASLGQLRYQWQPGDTATAGRYLAVVQCNYLRNTPLVLPTYGYYHVIISPTLP